MKSNKNVYKIYCYNVNTDRHLHYLLNSYVRHFFIIYIPFIMCFNVSIYPFFELITIVMRNLMSGFNLHDLHMLFSLSE